MNNDSQAQPTVKTIPTFKPGDTAIHKDSRQEHEVIKVTGDKKQYLKLRGVAGLLEITAFEKKA